MYMEAVGKLREDGRLLMAVRSYVVRAVRQLLKAGSEGLACCLNRLPGPCTFVVFWGQPSYTAKGGDNLSTLNDPVFLLDTRFQSAYDRGVQAVGWDYSIKWRVHVLIWAAETTSRLEGDFVELGTGRGMVMSSVLSYVDWNDLGKRAWLFDTFTPYNVDKVTGERRGSINPHYADSVEAVQDNFSTWSNVNIIPGELPGSLERAEIDRVAFLHVDLNAAEPEVESVRRLWPKVVLGGIVVFDDYVNRGRHEQFRGLKQVAEELGFGIVALPTGQGLAVKTQRRAELKSVR